ncbi:MAG: UbiD family decarboxylase [Dehalococcoidia bacterium]|nr:UbiD family decarboxylase [Dehalococcoidia bacterium]
MVYKGFREWLQLVENDGGVKHISGVDWNLEMGGIAEIVAREGKKPMPALLFDDIPGYPRGFRTLCGLMNSPRSLAMALDIPLEGSMELMPLLQRWRAKMRSHHSVAPKVVSSGPVQENVLSGEHIDVTIFPSPKVHELDGGRYIGTACAIIQKDPDTGWVNLGVYRSMVIDRNRVALHILEGQDGRMIMDKYFERKQAMPVAIAIGVDPALWAAALVKLPWGTSEFDYAGGIKGEPIEVIKGPYTGLPLPAHAEIIIEGECIPGELIDEGPFGEWQGYYANLGLKPVPEPVVRVKTVLHRNNPILTCATPAAPPKDYSLPVCFVRSGGVWDTLEAARVPGVKGVWNHDEGGSWYFTTVSIQQMYAGHSKQAGLIASQATGAFGRYTVVVDEDIDPSDLSQVIWAVSTRSIPERSLQILPRCPSNSADPTISPEEKAKVKVPPKPLFGSRCVIDACRPFEWRKEFYPVTRISPEYREQLMKKFEGLFKELL